MCNSYLRGINVPTPQQYSIYINNLKCLSMELWFLCCDLVICSMTHLYVCRSIDICFIFWNIIQYHLILLFRLFQFLLFKTLNQPIFYWYWCIPTMQNLFCCLYSTYLFSRMERCYDFMYCISGSRYKRHHFHQSPGSFHCRMI